ncbi:MAG: hypothetical protein Q4G71_04125 [Pseudomonadota bacterium]|nr:hypothetical protein [Pseudomonadota bacterium]
MHPPNTENLYLEGSAVHLQTPGRPPVEGYAALTSRRFVFTGPSSMATLSLPLASMQRVYELRSADAPPLLVIDTDTDFGLTFRLQRHDKWLRLMQDPAALIALSQATS